MLSVTAQGARVSQVLAPAGHARKPVPFEANCVFQDAMGNQIGKPFPVELDVEMAAGKVLAERISSALDPTTGQTVALRLHPTKKQYWQGAYRGVIFAQRTEMSGPDLRLNIRRKDAGRLAVKAHVKVLAPEQVIGKDQGRWQVDYFVEGEPKPSPYEEFADTTPQKVGKRHPHEKPRGFNGVLNVSPLAEGEAGSNPVHSLYFKPKGLAAPITYTVASGPYRPEGDPLSPAYLLRVHRDAVGAGGPTLRAGAYKEALTLLIDEKGPLHKVNQNHNQGMVEPFQGPSGHAEQLQFSAQDRVPPAVPEAQAADWTVPAAVPKQPLSGRSFLPKEGLPPIVPDKGKSAVGEDPAAAMDEKLPKGKTRPPMIVERAKYSKELLDEDSGDMAALDHFIELVNSPGNSYRDAAKQALGNKHDFKRREGFPNVYQARLSDKHRIFLHIPKPKKGEEPQPATLLKAGGHEFP